jgi:hypothetical protein
MIPIPISHLSGEFIAPPSIVYTNTKSFQFDGQGERVDFGAVPTAGLGQPYSFSAWVKPIAKFNGQHMIVANFPTLTTTSNPREGLLIWYNNASRLHVYHSYVDPGGTVTGIRVRYLTSLGNGVWHHIVVTYNGTGNRFGLTTYRNNSPQSITNVYLDNWSSGTTTPGDLFVAARDDGTQSVSGRIFDVTYWDKELSAAEVSELYNSGTPLDANTHSAASNLRFYARFGNDPDDDATATTGVIKDRVGGFDGAPINTEPGDIVTDAP